MYSWCSDSPFDMPLSISELALRPRRPVLLLLCPSLLPLRISLFLVMTGVSANGSIMLRAFGSRCFATVKAFWVGVFTPTRAVRCSDCASGAGVICFFLSFSTGALFFVRVVAGVFVAFGRASNCSLSPERRVDRRRCCVSEDSGSITVAAGAFRRAVDLAGRGSAERAGFAGGSSGIGLAAGAACAFEVLFDVRRENWKPSSSSSYAAFAAFFVAPLALLLAPFTSVLGRFGAGASSSSKACLTLLRRVVGRFAAIGSDCRGERANTVVMDPVAVGVVGSFTARASARQRECNRRFGSQRVQSAAAASERCSW